MRTDFQRDRDRILYSKSFRRLSGKTQVFLTRSNDHVRNRLTHSLEVNQIASTTAKMLGLNDELIEAISLGHDIGHTPFGHVGERTLNLIMNNCICLLDSCVDLDLDERGFKHNLQAIRILSELHRIYPYLKGTNLTNFTLYGIAKHSKMEYKSCEHYNNGLCYRKNRIECLHAAHLSVGFYQKYNRIMKINGDDIFAWSFEADVVEYADEISQRHHDVEDAILMNILLNKDIVDKIEECFGECLSASIRRKLKEISRTNDFFGPKISQFLVGMYNNELINNTRKKLVEFANYAGIKNRKHFLSIYKDISPEDAKSIVSYSDEFKAADKCFHSFLRDTILNSHRAQRMDGKGSYLIERLFKAYYTNPRQLHDSTILSVYNMINNKNETIGSISKPKLGSYRNSIASSLSRSDPCFEKKLRRAICDHIAGMTDNFVIEEHSRLYGDGTI
ncbi:MAG TPA: dNTP triphosphohydrolase [Desulfovibrio sp.]|uniref:deoxyguanosinetriphosphate triphosphohydrolase family protein n=1 Tax=Desulfovibrio sp. TaxID=885 RepID=UPI002C699CBF|nr:dNTP triphosphohydrolase [Desulfovibrio sp.]HMM38272.1 dNTP triphosphohydrolase [Desulfovibrio sp.]